MLAIFLLCLSLTFTHSSLPTTAPHSLLVNKRRSPFAVVSTPSPTYSWVVAHQPLCGPNQRQTAYQIQWQDSTNHTQDTWRQNSSQSLHVRHAPPPLQPSTRYTWRVKTWNRGDVADVECPSAFSAWSEVITTPFLGFANDTTPIWFPASSGAEFTLHRLVVQPTVPFTSATAFVTALQSGAQQKLLGAYRLYINAQSVGIGPGRGEGRTNAGNHTPYDSIDVTRAALLSKEKPLVIGLQCYANHGAGSVLMELHFQHIDGTSSVVATTGDSNAWKSFDATMAYGPVHQEGGYKAPQENQEAALMPVGWKELQFKLNTTLWKTPTARPSFATYSKPTLPLNITTGFAPVRWVQVGQQRWFGDFGTEFQGGLHLLVHKGALPPRTRLQVTMSEELVGEYQHSTTLLYPMRTGNTYRSVWTTANEDAVVSRFEHHEYMEFRYVEVLILGPQAARTQVAPPFTLTAWRVQYPYYEGDSSFTSSNAVLNQVWALCENTLRVTSLDTSTDSNTRERLPYEADGLITGMSRLSLQKEFDWLTHSWTHNIWNPTWPTEWRQTLVHFAHIEYMYMNELTLIDRFAQTMEAQTQSGCIDRNGTHLVDFTACARQTGGMGEGGENDLRDIVDWPNSQRDGFVFGPMNTVINAYAVSGLRQLVHLGNAGGGARWNLPARAASLAKQATATGKKGETDRGGNEGTGSFSLCDFIGDVDIAPWCNGNRFLVQWKSLLGTMDR
jgi:hypothetical protein